MKNTPIQQSRLPIVILHCTAQGAQWFGKYFLNISENSTLKRGPYNSIQDACQAIEATGHYSRRSPEPASGPHFDQK